MLKKDHILKLLQQLDQALKKINGLKNEGDTESALQIARESYVKLLGMKIPDQESERFLNSILKDKALEFDELNVLAELLKEEGDIYDELGDRAKAWMKYNQALEVFHYLNSEEKVFSFEREAKISMMLERLKYLED